MVLVVNLVLENLLEPRVMGSSLDLHPAFVLLATVGGGCLNAADAAYATTAGGGWKTEVVEASTGSWRTSPSQKLPMAKKLIR